jgi:adenine-specific DNA methylase
MTEFYENHSADPDTVGKVIYDPFMGGGTTVVEALRLGCKVVGADLNPVAWFIVKNEIQHIEIEDAKGAFKRLAERPVKWSGKTVRETLLSQYKTTCPCCEEKDEADLIYTYWVKSAICTNPMCRKEVPLYSDYIVAQKKPSIRFWREVKCPRPQCGQTFDWERESATLIGNRDLTINDGRTSAGELRGNARWTYSNGDTVECPWCEHEVKPMPTAPRTTTKSRKLERKKVLLTALLCPHCESVWQWRGELPDRVSCKVCQRSYGVFEGNAADKGKFVCSCGNKDAIIESLRRLPETCLLPSKPYAVVIENL